MSETILIYCGVKYADKDQAKEKGAKWDKDRKSWYFEFNIYEFESNEELHTYNFKPYSVSLKGMSKYIKNSTNPIHIIINNIYCDANNRHVKYVNA